MNITTGATVDQILHINNIRDQLIRLEDTIIFRELRGAARGATRPPA